MGVRRGFHARRVTGTALVAVVVLGGLVGVRSASADSLSSDFEALTLGPVHGQDGWTSTGAAGSGCAVYDHEVASNASFTNDPPSFGAKSLRISNAVTSGCFSDHTFSKKTVDEAGEPTATAGAFGSGVRQASYSGQFTFVPTTSAPQPGLSVVVSPDRGDGARMSWVQIADTGAPAGLDLNFTDYVDAAPFGTPSTPGDGCGAGDTFPLTAVATGLSRAQPHTVSIQMAFVPGPRNDVVKVSVDGVLKHTGRSWEDYFRWCEAGQTSRTVRSLLFRTGGTAVPALAGQGLLVDGVTSTTQAIPLPVLGVGNAAVNEGHSGITIANVPVTLSTTYPHPVTVRYRTENGSAKVPLDYPSAAGVFTIPANTTSAALPIAVFGGTTLEKNESFKVKLTDTTNARITTPNAMLIATVTIRNDELPRVVLKASGAKEGKPSIVKITIKQPYAGTLNLSVHTGNGTAAAPGDFAAVNTTVPFPSQQLGPKTLSVTTKLDGVREPVETFTVVATGGAAAVSDTVKIAGNST
jgi:hypothetical protein